MPRKLAVSEDRIDEVLWTYLGKRKVQSAREASNPLPVLDPLEGVQREAVILASRELAREARARGILSGVQVSLDRVLGMETVKRGFSSRKKDVLSKGIFRFSFASDLMRISPPLHVQVRVEDGEVYLPDHFEEGPEFSPEGIAGYCRSAGTLPSSRFVYSSWGDSTPFFLGKCANPLEVSTSFRERGFSVSPVCRGEEFRYEVVGGAGERELASQIFSLAAGKFPPGRDFSSEHEERRYCEGDCLDGTNTELYVVEDLEGLSGNGMEFMVLERGLKGRWERINPGKSLRMAESEDMGGLERCPVCGLPWEGASYPPLEGIKLSGTPGKIQVGSRYKRGYQVIVDSGYRVVGPGYWANRINGHIIGGDPATVQGMNKEAYIVSWGIGEVDPAELRGQGDHEDLFLIKGIPSLEIGGECLSPSMPKESSDLDAYVDHEDDRRIIQERISVREWLVGGGGSWSEMVEEFQARFEDPTYVPMRLRDIIWSLAHGGDEVWALDPQGEPYRVRYGCDVTGSEEIWIERSPAEEHTAQEIPEVHPAGRPPSPRRGQIAQAIHIYLVQNPQIELSGPALNSLIEEIDQEITAGHPLNMDYIRTRVESAQNVQGILG